MKASFYKNLSTFFGYFPIAMIFGLMFIVSQIEISDLDLWLHIAAGKYITLNQIIPDEDFLSFTIAGRPWVNHEWLFQVVVYNLYERWGDSGILWMQTIVVGCTLFVLLLIGYNKEKQLSTTFYLLLVYLVYQQRFTTRPDLFSLLFFALFIYILALHIDKKWAPAGLFIIQVLWGNMHGFFFFGPLFILIGLVSEWIKRRIRLPYEWNESGRLNDNEYKTLKISLGVVVLACLINPNFVFGAWYPIGVFFSLSGENQIFFKYIQELRRPLEWGTVLNTSEFIYFKLLLLISGISFIFNRRRIDISAFLFWLVFLIFSFKAARNTSYFAFAAYLVIITNSLYFTWEDIVPLRFTEKKFQYLTGCVMKLLLLAWIFQFSTILFQRGYYDFDKYERKSEYKGISQRSYPDKAADFLVENKIKGNFFNDFNSGAYLLGRCHPDIKVFIDGRTEAYGGHFFKIYLKIFEEGNSEIFEKFVKKHNIAGAFLNSSRQHIPVKILKYLYQSEDWKLVYFDYDAVIFLRNIPQNKDHIEKFELDLKRLNVKKLDQYRLASSRVTPYRHYYRAYTLESLGLHEKALAEAKEAIRISPSYGAVYKLAGKIYAEMKDFPSAFENLRLASVYLPDDKEVRYNMALAYMDLEKYKGAIKQYEIIKTMWPNEKKVYFTLAKAYIKDQQFDNASVTIKYALRIDPGAAKDTIKLADAFMEEKEYTRAKEIYELLSKRKSDLPGLYEKMGDVYRALGDNQKADEHYQKAKEGNLSN